jgi:hypothetical protein
VFQAPIDNLSPLVTFGDVQQQADEHQTAQHA